MLKKLKDKSSEHYALLGLAQAFSIQFVTGMKAGIISEEANGNANKALELDNKNIRAYYVLGSNDFYTPEEFGGGKEAEKYLLKAIEYPENSSGLACMPSWGKDYTYQMLIELYQKRGNNDLAKRYANEGVKLFPENEQIKKEQEKLEKL
ncbi:MAG: hypothetical protein HC831_09310 [Chloroflexia bacterium]|nr:hypothetical protein [Chloroflexia bacterium]